MDLIRFTDRALDAIIRYRETLQIPDGLMVRVGIRQKNETNKRLLIGFDEKTERDQETIAGGIKVIYSPGEIFFFAGMIIDYLEEEGRKGFTFVEQKRTAE